MADPRPMSEAQLQSAVTLAELPAWPAAPDAADILLRVRFNVAPVSGSRPRVSAAEYTVVAGQKVKTRKAHGYSTKELREYKETLSWALKRHVTRRNDVDDLGVHALFHVHGRQRRDVDNLAKPLLDACNGIVWRDDKQVTRLMAEIVRDSSEPHSELVVYIAERRARDCLKCGKPLAVEQIARRSIYCSKSCYDEGQRRGAYRTCVACGEAVYRDAEKSQAAQVFCSPACRTSGRGTCRECGRPNSHAPSASSFCSAECSVAWHGRRPLAAPKTKRGTCADCGAPTSAVTSKRCRACHLAHRGRIQRELEAVR